MSLQFRCIEYIIGRTAVCVTASVLVHLMCKDVQQMYACDVVCNYGSNCNVILVGAGPPPSPVGNATGEDALDSCRLNRVFLW